MSFVYKTLDLERPSFRLLRLAAGRGEINCEVFQAWFDRLEDLIPYEALSYTWGGTEKSETIYMSDCELNDRATLHPVKVTSNLYSALTHLRLEDSERILWIDALCIDQDNLKERGHQVAQMAQIYGRAERVIAWLGVGSQNPTLLMNCIKALQRKSISYPCNSWNAGDERWDFVWSEALIEVFTHEPDSFTKFWLRTSLKELLEEPWFRRVWIVQEVGKARSVSIQLGKTSVSSRIFTMVPSLLSVDLNPHSQAILDIMPGPSRKNSWWTQKRDLRTLSAKFARCEATEPRDKIYALLGISSDASDTTRFPVDYKESIQKLMCRTFSYLSAFHEQGYNWNHWPYNDVGDFLGDVESFEKIFRQSLDHDDVVLATHLIENSFVQVNTTMIFGGRWPLRPLLYAIAQRHPRMVKTLLHFGADANFAGDLYMNALGYLFVHDSGQSSTEITEEIADILVTHGANANGSCLGEASLLHKAATSANIQFARYLLTHGAKVSIKNGFRETPLHKAVSKFPECMEMVQILVEYGAEVNCQTVLEQTPLYIAVACKHWKIVRLLLDLGANPGLPALGGATPLHVATKSGDPSIIQLLIERGTSLRCLDVDQQTPLHKAVIYRDHAVMKLVMYSWAINQPDDKGLTPLHWAAIVSPEKMEFLRQHGGPSEQTIEAVETSIRNAKTKRASQHLNTPAL